MPILNRAAVERLLEQRKATLTPGAYYGLKRWLKEDDRVVDTYKLNEWCRDLKCLPSDIVEPEA